MDGWIHFASVVLERLKCSTNLYYYYYYYYYYQIKKKDAVPGNF